MAVQTFTLLSKANHADGATVSPTVTIPANVLGARFYVDSSQAGVLQYSSPSQHIDFACDIDRGDGAGLVPDCGFTSQGGAVDRGGTRIDPSATTDLAGEGGHSLQATLTVSGGPVRFGFFVDVTT